MVNRRIFVDEPDPQPSSEEVPAGPQEAQPREKDWYEDVELAREWGKLIDKGILITGKVIGAVRTGEVEKFRQEVAKLLTDWQAASRTAAGQPPPANSPSNNSQPSSSSPQPSTPQSTNGGKEIVEMERKIDLDKLKAEIKKGLEFLALVKPNLTMKELPAMFQENHVAGMKEVAKAIESSMTYVAKGAHASPQS